MLDEYVGLPASHPQSYRNVIDAEFVSRVDFGDGAVHGPDGMAEDLTAASAEYDHAIAEAGGIDCRPSESVRTVISRSTSRDRPWPPGRAARPRLCRTARIGEAAAVGHDQCVCLEEGVNSGARLACGPHERSGSIERIQSPRYCKENVMLPRPSGCTYPLSISLFYRSARIVRTCPCDLQCLSSCCVRNCPATLRWRSRCRALTALRTPCR